MKNQIAVAIPQQRPSNYTVFIEEGLLTNPSSWLPENSKKLVIITDDQVKKIHGLTLEKTLNQVGYQTIMLSFPEGEKSKNRHTQWALEEQMLTQQCGRDTLILALGGGVTGDLAGFIAATYMRGIPFIQIPTTLLAMLDSSIGGKTGIDTPHGKNLIGAFWQPVAVVSDIAVLKTLPQKQLINGLMEAIKIFLTSDVKSLEFLEKNQDAMLHANPEILADLVGRAMQLKVDIVTQDERENNQRMILNFGHTIGHALEQVTDYQLLHGYAVAYGMLVEAKIACLSGLLAEENYLKIESILQYFGIHAEDLKKFDREAVVLATHLDKKRKDHVVRYVLLEQLGKVAKEGEQWVHPVSDEMVSQAWLSVIGV